MLRPTDIICHVKLARILYEFRRPSQRSWSSDTDFDHRTPEHLDGSGLTAKAEYDEVGCSDIKHLDTGFEDRYPRPIEDCRATTQELSLVLVFAHTGKYIPPIGTYGEGLSDV